jgi:hypothetical protein
MKFFSDQQTGLRPWQHGVVFLLACILSVTRRPDVVFHAQFLHEDGHTWFADVYNYGWWAGVCRTYAGYHHVFPRLGAALALLVPLACAPLVMTLIGICVQVMPVNLLLSSRSSAWGSMGLRTVLSVIYIALPNTREMLNNISQSQWPLALCAFLVLVASPPRSIASRLFDISLLLLCGLTGPQCAFLLPIALFLAWIHRERWMLVAAGVLAATCCIQAWGLLNGGFASRPHSDLGASPAMLIRILAGHVFLGTLLGSNGIAAISSPSSFYVLLCAAVGGLTCVALCWTKAPLPLKLFVLLTAALLTVSLISPTAFPPPGVSMWQLLAQAGGIRYWYFPTIAFAWLLLCGFHNGGQALKRVVIFPLCFMSFGVAREWRIPPMKDLNWAEQAKRFEAAPPGATMTFPENPAGWTLTLIKHPAGR